MSAPGSASQITVLYEEGAMIPLSCGKEERMKRLFPCARAPPKQYPFSIHEPMF